MCPKKIHIIVVIILLGCARVFSQELKFSGKILDAENNQPLPYASLIIENSNYSSITNDKGIFYFDITKHLDLPINLQISYIGYEEQKIEILNTDAEILILLKLKTLSLSEIKVSARQVFIASKDNISSNSLSNNQILGLSGLTKDPLKSIQMLPGVSSNNEMTAKYNVRGGSYDENLVLLNGIEIYNPFHIKESPTASVSIFNVDMVKNLDFSTGGFNAEYGNALSSMLNVNYETGSTEKFQGKVSMNFLDMGLLTEGPIGNKGNYIIAARKSNLDYILRSSNAIPDIHLNYDDIQSQVDYQITPNDKIKFNLIYARDNYSLGSDVETYSSSSFQIVNGKTDISNLTYYKDHPCDDNYRNLLIGVVSENKLEDNLVSKSSISFYYDSEDEKMIYNDVNVYSYRDNPQFWQKNTSVGNINRKLVTTTFSLKNDMIYLLSPNISFKAGLNYKSINNDYNSEKFLEKISSSNINQYLAVNTQKAPYYPADNDTLSVNLNTYRLESYIQTSVQFLRDFTINFGTRFDYFDLNKQAKLSPRLNVSYSGFEGINLRIAWGIFFQPPTFNQYRLYRASADNTGYQRATHYIIGIDKNINENLTVGIEAYIKNYDNCIPTIKATNGSISYGDKQNNATAYSNGIDFQLMFNYDRFYLWTSYGYLVSREKIKNKNEGYYSRYSDQTHTLSATLGIDLGNGWNISFKQYYGSGYAYTPSNLVFDEKLNAFKWVTGAKNSAHLEAYQRLDQTITKSIVVLDNPMEIYLDIMNILNRRNVLSVEYSLDSNGKASVKKNKLLFVLPMLGVKYSF